MTPVFAANWKMNKTIEEARSFIQSLKQQEIPTNSDIIIAPSAHLLPALVEECAGTPIKIAAQNMFFEDKGAFTGEISPVQLKAAGVTHVIIGHSERRTLFGETDEIINKKLHAAYAHGLTPIFCIGENAEQRETGQAARIVIEQMQTALSGLPEDFIQQLIVAYEPVWAIGTGVTATPLQAEGIQSVIKEQLPQQTRVVYGGSVNTENAAALFKQPSVQGFLIGGASLEPDSFRAIWSVN